MEGNSRTSTRENLYKNLYGVEYKYGSLTGSRTDSQDDNVVKLNSASGSRPIELEAEPEEDLSGIKPFNPKRKTVKPYVAPTNFDGEAEIPFGNILDAPIN